MGYLTLFLSFFKIGLFTFGGGYAMLSLIRETVVSNGWLAEGELLNFIAVAESTPGPIAINMATFVGASQLGIFGSLVATLGVVLPSFLIILLIVTCIKNLLKVKWVNAFLEGVRPCIVAMVLATAVTMGISTFAGFSEFGDVIKPDFQVIGVFMILLLVRVISNKIFKKAPSPIWMICISAFLGIVVSL